MHLTGDLSFQGHGDDRSEDLYVQRKALQPVEWVSGRRSKRTPHKYSYLWGGMGESKAGPPGRASRLAGRQRSQLCPPSSAGTVFRSTSSQDRVAATVLRGCLVCAAVARDAPAEASTGVESDVSQDAQPEPEPIEAYDPSWEDDHVHEHCPREEDGH